MAVHNAVNELENNSRILTLSLATIFDALKIVSDELLLSNEIWFLHYNPNSVFNVNKSKIFCGLCLY